MPQPMDQSEDQPNSDNDEPVSDTEILADDLIAERSESGGGVPIGIIAGVAGGVALLLIVVSLLCWYKKRKARMSTINDNGAAEEEQLHLQAEGIQHRGMRNIANTQPIYQQQSSEGTKFKTLDWKTIDMYMPELDYTEQIGNKYNHLMCAVCLGNFEIKEKVRKLKMCKHIFHTRCLIHWLERDESCPLCKKDLKKEECKKAIIIDSFEEIISKKPIMLKNSKGEVVGVDMNMIKDPALKHIKNGSKKNTPKDRRLTTDGLLQDENTFIKETTKDRKAKPSLMNNDEPDFGFDSRPQTGIGKKDDINIPIPEQNNRNFPLGRPP